MTTTKPPRTRWSTADTELLRQHYADSSTSDLARALGREVKAVYAMVDKLGLKKSPEFIAADARKRIERMGHGAKLTQFKPGLVPWNKGKPGSTGTQVACRATQFCKGRPACDAHNYQPIGALRVNKGGVLERKVTDDPSIYPARRWVAEARLVWEAANGPVPAGCVIVFRPGKQTTDPERVTLDVLECLSRRELMLRNTVHRYGPEIARLAQLRGAINRQINQRTKEKTP
jgi:hypothetical protein